MPRTNNLKSKIVISWLQELHHDKSILTRKFFTNNELFDLYSSTASDENKIESLITFTRLLTKTVELKLYPKFRVRITRTKNGRKLNIFLYIATN